jgi:hypothetical protein
LANEPEAKAFKTFDQHYQKYLERALQGESFTVPALPPPDHDAGQPLDQEAQLQKLAELKKSTQL